MIAPVLIDLSGTINEFFLDTEETKSLSRYVLDNIGQEYERVWEKEIDNNLHQTRSEYRRGIFVEYPDDYSLIFGMTPRRSKLGMMLEEGASSFDIKKGFENSPKKHYKANGGWYLTVPFRHATSEAVAESAIFSSIMPQDVYRVAKTSPKPLSLNQLPSGYRQTNLSKAGYQHKAAIYEGLQRRDISKSEKENRGGYFTFRRVSDKSEENSWQHSGFAALNLMEKALQGARFDYVVDKAIDEFLTRKFT